MNETSYVQPFSINLNVYILFWFVKDQYEQQLKHYRQILMQYFHFFYSVNEIHFDEDTDVEIFFYLIRMQQFHASVAAGNLNGNMYFVIAQYVRRGFYIYVYTCIYDYVVSLLLSNLENNLIDYMEVNIKRFQFFLHMFM